MPVHDEGGVGHDPSVTQYATDANLAARQRLWNESHREPAFDLFEWVLSLVPARGRTVEVGCGNGSYLARRPGAVGVDLSMGMLASVTSANPLVNADAQCLPFTDGAFDVVLAPHMLYHVPDRRAAAHELRRITRRGGVCVAVTNGGNARHQLKSLVESVVGNGWRWARDPEAEFKLENGAEQLAVAFESVERLDAPTVTTYVTDPDLLAAYVGSIADAYEASAGVPWSTVVDACRARATDVIERDGAFVITGAVGAFVCR